MNEIAEYFKFKYSGKYYVEMKRHWAMFMLSSGRSLRYISEMIYGNTNSVQAVNSLLNGTVSDVVKNNFRYWIEDKIYPISYLSVNTKKIIRITKNGSVVYDYETKFKLKSKEQYERDRNKNNE